MAFVVATKRKVNRNLTRKHAEALKYSTMRILGFFIRIPVYDLERVHRIGRGWPEKLPILRGQKQSK